MVAEIVAGTVAAAALAKPGWRRSVDTGDRAAPHLVFDWRPDGSARELDVEIDRLAEILPAAVAEVAGLSRPQNGYRAGETEA